VALVSSATLSGNVALNDTKIKLSAFTNPATSGVSAPTYLVVDGEAMLVADASLSPTLSVVRGYNSPIPGVATMPACAHKTLAPVVYGLSSDFTQTASTDGRAGSPVISLSVNDTAVTLPVVDATVYITKAGVLASTILDPNKDQTNTIKMVSLTANAHLITYTAGWYQNTTTSDIATFPATSGAVLTFVAKNGVWNLVATADDGVTVA